MKTGRCAILAVESVMLPRLLHLHPATCRRLTRLSKEAERDGAYRVAKRLRAVVLNAEGRTSGELAAVLKAPRSKISEWLARYQADGIDGLLEGCRFRKAAGVERGTAPTTGGHSGQRPGGLRIGQRGVDLAHDCVGDRGGVRRYLPSRTRAQAPAHARLLRAAAAPGAGTGQRRRAGPMAPARLSAD